MEQSSSKKTIGIIVILIIIIVGILLMMKKSAPITVPTATTDQAAQQSPAPVVDTTPAGLIKASGTSDASLDQDTASIDAQLKAFQSDATSANQVVQ